MGETYEGIPREDIPWFPQVDPSTCTACGKCVEFCHKGVFVIEDMPKVTDPYSCVVGCTGCEKVCPEGAISFPSMRDLVQVLRSIKSPPSCGCRRG